MIRWPVRADCSKRISCGNSFVFATRKDFASDSKGLAAIIGGLVVILTRVISIQFDLHLPKFSK